MDRKKFDNGRNVLELDRTILSLFNEPNDDDRHGEGSSLNDESWYQKSSRTGKENSIEFFLGLF